MLVAELHRLGAGAWRRISGSASYRERIALPPDAVFEAMLEDVARADAPATVVTSTRVPSARVPIAFTIALRPGAHRARTSAMWCVAASRWTAS